ncbi:hypothetical protein JVT61DRAFT_12427 [Boletus reticuloceps]|uniref:Uncharacterized protein n=1 Tax=Boletus reticuloceps TaxID=495285 RepID=A0A8I2YDX9_9AGAM|nr:hypothetical protein JVT61DRAFT_12427 [Boletus reticuloceps]
MPFLSFFNSHVDEVYALNPFDQSQSNDQSLEHMYPPSDDKKPPLKENFPFSFAQSLPSPARVDCVAPNPDTCFQFDESNSTDMPGALIPTAMDGVESNANDIPGALVPYNVQSTEITFNPWSSSVRRFDDVEGIDLVARSGTGSKVMVVEVDRSHTLRGDVYALQARLRGTAAEFEKQQFVRSAIRRYKTIHDEHSTRLQSLQAELEARSVEIATLDKVIADRDATIAVQTLEIESLKKCIKEVQVEFQAMRRAEAEAQSMLQELTVCKIPLV